MNRVEPNRNVYVGHRYVPLLVGEWDKSIQYEGLSIVTYQGASYTSKKRTPAGIDIENEEFWVLTGNYNAQIEYYRDDVKSVSDDLAQAKIDLNGRIDGINENFTTHKNEVNQSLESHKSKVNTNLENHENEVEFKINSRGVDVKNPPNNMTPAIGDGKTNDTQALKQFITAMNNNEFKTLILTEGTYLIDESIGELTSDGNIIMGVNAEIKLDNDIENVIINSGDNIFKDFSIDYNNYTCLSMAGFTTHSPLIIKNVNMKNLYGRGEDTNTNEQYMIRINTTSKKVDIIDCRFENSFNRGDGVATYFGFAGFVFIKGNALTGNDTLDVNINGNIFRNTKTIYPIGLPYNDKLKDIDSDGVRSFITGDDSFHNHENLRINFKNNEFYECQKRAYKISFSDVNINNDYVDLSESDIPDNPGALSVALFRGCSVKAVNNDFKSRIRYSVFEIVDCHDIDIDRLDIEIVGDDAIRDGSAGYSMLLSFPGKVLGNVNVSNIRSKNLHTLIQSIAKNQPVKTKFNINNITMINGVRFFYMDVTDNESLTARKMYVETSVINGTTSDRGLRLIGESGAKILLEDIEVYDTISRSAYPESHPDGIHPTAVTVGVQADLNNVRVTGEVSEFSMIQLNNMHNAKFFNLQAPYINIIGTTDCILTHSKIGELIVGAPTDSNLTQEFNVESSILL